MIYSLLLSDILNIFMASREYYRYLGQKRLNNGLIILFLNNNACYKYDTCIGLKELFLMTKDKITGCRRAHAIPSIFSYIHSVAP